MPRRAVRLLLGSLLLIAVTGLLYFRSNHWKLISTDRIYAELKHPDWSERLLRDKAIHPNLGSGNYEMLYLMDVRRVRVPISVAVAYYDREVERLGLKECHVDKYPEASDKFKWEWSEMHLEVPTGDDILVISQRFPSNDGNIRTHKAEAEQVRGGNGD